MSDCVEECPHVRVIEDAIYSKPVVAVDLWAAGNPHPFQPIKQTPAERDAMNS